MVGKARHSVLPMLHAQPKSAKPTVLVVDDSAAMRRYLQVLLELDSYQVETASNGTEALQRLHQGCAPAVVLLDLEMPCMDGLKTLGHLMELWPDLKVIICSGVDDPAQARRAASLGAKAYLRKPVQHLYLSAAVERCLGDSSALPVEDSLDAGFTAPPPG